MVIVLAIHVFYVQGDACILREGLEPFLEEFGVHIAELRLREIDLPDQIRALRYVDRDAGAGLIHRNDGGRIAADALEIAKCPAHGLADHDAGIFRRVVEIDVQIALRADLEVHQRVARKLLQHMVEEADTRIDVIFALAVEIEGDEDTGLLGLAFDGRYTAFILGLHGSGPVGARR